MATSPAADSVCGTWAEHCCWIPPTPEEREAMRAALDAGQEPPIIGQCPYLRDEGANWRAKKLPRRWVCTLCEAACAAEGVATLTAAVKARVRATPEHQAIVKRIRDHLQPYTSTGLVLPWTDCLDWPGSHTCNCCGRVG